MSKKRVKKQNVEPILNVINKIFSGEPTKIKHNTENQEVVMSQNAEKKLEFVAQFSSKKKAMKAFENAALWGCDIIQSPEKDDAKKPCMVLSLTKNQSCAFYSTYNGHGLKHYALDFRMSDNGYWPDTDRVAQFQSQTDSE